ncbi:hypothetical protein P692DRAFT_20736109, partial [Suillus brevipes Sb2]
HFVDVAIVQLYSPPDHALLQLSSQTVVSCTKLDDIVAVNVKNISSVIAMVPHTPTLPSGAMEDRFFMLDKPELDISKLICQLRTKKKILRPKQMLNSTRLIFDKACHTTAGIIQLSVQN